MTLETQLHADSLTSIENHVALEEDAHRLAKFDVIVGKKILVWQLDKSSLNKTFFEWAANYAIAHYPKYYRTPANVTELRRSQALTQSNRFAGNATLSVLEDASGEPFQGPLLVARLPSEVKRRLLEDSILYWEAKMRDGHLRALNDEQLGSRKPQVKYGDENQKALLQSKEAETSAECEVLHQKQESRCHC
ncbi:hypothetical protein HII31_12655 [Pseudocercospora fuligena]|uniref:Uncharacterized protein n=1 Tax=Pseudocercospora fuligena TaxID=685502 RepID=A0A8H6R8Y6_9PEZI|nr:hypothetical protein HII31_12655 [Pseudocercospora fuligena]